MAPRRRAQIEKELAAADALRPDGLTNRQAAFVEAYLGPAHLNATAAARIAGYSGDDSTLAVSGHRLLMNAKVQSRVRARLASMGVDRQLILERIGELAGASMADLLEIDSDGRSVRLDLIKAARSGALGTIREYTEELAGSQDAPILTRKVKIHDPAKYIELLAKHVGIVGDESAAAGAANLDDPSHWSQERLRAYYEEKGWPLPDALKPRPASVGSGLVDASGKAITRESIVGAGKEQKK